MGSKYVYEFFINLKSHILASVMGTVLWGHLIYCLIRDYIITRYTLPAKLGFSMDDPWLIYESSKYFWDYAFGLVLVGGALSVVTFLPYMVWYHITTFEDEGENEHEYNRRVIFDMLKGMALTSFFGPYLIVSSLVTLYRKYEDYAYTSLSEKYKWLN